MFITSMSQVKKIKPSEILSSLKTSSNTMNVAIATVRNPDSLNSLLQASIKRYKALTDEIERLEATLCVYDLEPKKIKVSKRVAKVPKYARGITK